MAPVFGAFARFGFLRVCHYCAKCGDITRICYRLHETVDANADIVGLCAANAVAGLSGTFTVNGSPTQTAMAVQAGATSQRAQLVFAAVTLCVLLFFTGPLQYLPRCILGSVVFCVAVGMIDVAALTISARRVRGSSVWRWLRWRPWSVLGWSRGFLLPLPSPCSGMCGIVTGPIPWCSGPTP